MIVAIETISKRKHRASSSGADPYVYIRQRKFIFWARFVKIMEVNIAKNLSVLFFNMHNIG